MAQRATTQYQRDVFIVGKRKGGGQVIGDHRDIAHLHQLFGDQHGGAAAVEDHRIAGIDHGRRF
ncbi:hypothetical protein D3C79_439390 [compost metagenome]